METIKTACLQGGIALNGAEFMKIMKSRRSIRHFADKGISPELIGELLAAAVTAPSAGNRRDWDFHVVTSQEVKQEMLSVTKSAWDKVLSECDSEIVSAELGKYRSNFEWFADAPAVIAVSVKQSPVFLDELFGKAGANIAGGYGSAFMAAENLLLAAHASGLGGCCLTGPLAASAEFRKILKLEKRREIVCLLALGYPAGRQ